MIEDHFVCNKEDELWYLGYSNGRYPAIDDPSILTSTLIIPETINGHQIDVIGQNAFYEFDVLEIIHVNCQIKRIMNYAFAHLYNLKEIYLPSSLESLDNNAITAYNFTVEEQYTKAATAHGLLLVIFPPGSKLTLLKNRAITRKERIEIFFWGNKSPSHEGDPFYRTMTGKVIIHAPYLSRFCGYTTIHNITCKTSLISIRRILFFLLIIY